MRLCKSVGWNFHITNHLGNSYFNNSWNLFLIKYWSLFYIYYCKLFLKGNIDDLNFSILKVLLLSYFQILHPLFVQGIFHFQKCVGILVKIYIYIYEDIFKWAKWECRSLLNYNTDEVTKSSSTINFKLSTN